MVGLRKTRILILFAMCVGLSACNHSPAPVLAPETIFDRRDMHVITSFFNNRMGTICTLYGNRLALGAAQSEDKIHAPGEIFTLVTWKQEANPGWFGGNINGAQQSVETVRVLPAENKGVRMDYEVEKTGQQVLKKDQVDKQERIHFIFAQKASVFP